MKKILITGEHSYVGNAIEAYLKHKNEVAGTDCYLVDKISLKNSNWKEYSFAGYDTVLHVAGIAHADVSGVSEEEQKRYYNINGDLAKETALKARQDGVKQFVYFSSVIVYGESAKVGKIKEIGPDTEPSPANFYGDSKLQGERAVLEVQTGGFSVAVLRIPMIYGRGSKGNFPVLVKLASKMPVFPDIKNRRSMIYVDNLAEYVRILIEQCCGGIFYPQNDEYVTTTEMVRLIAEAKGRKIRIWKVLNPFVFAASVVPGKVGKLTNKAFGSLTIQKNIDTEIKENYCLFSLEDSIKKSVSE